MGQTIEVQKTFGRKFITLNYPRTMKPLLEHEKRWYICAIRSCFIRNVGGEMWVEPDHLIVLFEDLLHPRGYSYTAMREMLYGNWSSYGCLKRLVSERGKVFHVFEMRKEENHRELPLALLDEINNTQIIYEPLTTAMKQAGRNIIGINATSQEMQDLRINHAAPKIEILL